MEKLKDGEIAGLNQEIKGLNEQLSHMGHAGQEPVKETPKKRTKLDRQNDFGYGKVTFRR